MRLIVEPDDGVTPILQAIERARRTIDVHLFRLGHKGIEKALAAAIARGVVVRTLVAHTRGSGEKGLRKLEQRLLEMGATVSRTADELIRYHGKIMIVDGAVLYVLAFNFVTRDIDHSRSLGIATRQRRVVQEAIKLFEADFNRQPYTGGVADLVVSPVNARERLSAFLRGARRQLLVYDASLTDNALIRILKERVKAGVALRIIGKVEKGHEGVAAWPLKGERQHLRAIVRDGRAVFIGSQSLRKIELEARREIGVIVRDVAVARRIARIFEEDWKGSAPPRERERREEGREHATV
jgi:phosphatidylserine/phosphatidylglycerophosphate/cardiolipin synthase-like enzyme